MTTKQKSIQTVTKQAVHCPNCGALAERWHYPDRTKTECSVCDYLMVTCPQTGNVIEAQAPGLYAGKLQPVKSVLVGVK
ncbi:MAG: pyruvate formate lyase-activating protein [Lyngbya sp.]|nr:pyruvate formate lyase-activating protein [Lyngbya sp.]